MTPLRKNTEQDWLKTNLAKFTRILQGQRDLLTVGKLISLGAGATRFSSARSLLYNEWSRRRSGAEASRELRRTGWRKHQATFQTRRRHDRQAVLEQKGAFF